MWRSVGAGGKDQVAVSLPMHVRGWSTFAWDAEEAEQVWPAYRHKSLPESRVKF